eukprot:7386708-Prymnesium_polylepis.1
MDVSCPASCTQRERNWSCQRVWHPSCGQAEAPAPVALPSPACPCYMYSYCIRANREAAQSLKSHEPGLIRNSYIMHCFPL